MTVLRVEVANQAFAPEYFTNITVYSSNLRGRADISVYASAKQDRTNIPIVVLLHGVYGSHWVWSQLGGAEKVYERLRAQGLNEFVLVMPSDGCFGEGSGYLPLQNANYEKWIVEDVIDAVCEHIPSCSPQSKKFITGLSMGGYGALRLGFNYPNVFSAISAHSSITTIEDFIHFVDDNTLEPLRKNTDKYHGDLLKTAYAQKAKLPPFRFDCGKNDVLFEANQRLSEGLVEASISHQFDVFSGEHTWEYWHEHLADSLRYFNKFDVQQ
jgi:enterochelin esterase-like enzyme